MGASQGLALWNDEEPAQPRHVRSLSLSGDGGGVPGGSRTRRRCALTRGRLPLSHLHTLALALACCWIARTERVAMGVTLRPRAPAHLLDVSEAPRAVRAPGVGSRRARAQAVRAPLRGLWQRRERRGHGCGEHGCQPTLERRRRSAGGVAEAMVGGGAATGRRVTVAETVVAGAAGGDTVAAGGLTVAATAGSAVVVATATAVTLAAGGGGTGGGVVDGGGAGGGGAGGVAVAAIAGRGADGGCCTDRGWDCGDGMMVAALGSVPCTTHHRAKGINKRYRHKINTFLFIFTTASLTVLLYLYSIIIRDRNA